MLKSEDLTFVEFLHREEMRRRRHASEDRMANEQEQIIEDYMRLESALKSLNDGMGVQINFIDSNRLFSSPENRERNRAVRNISEERGIYGRRIYEEPVSVERENIVNFSKALQFQIRGIRQKYSDVSEMKDRDFPDRLVQYVFSERDSLTEEEIAKKLIELEKIREDLEKVGLVSEGKTTTLPKNKNLDPTMLKFYSQYIEDNEDKLKIFDGMKRKLELFLDIINNKTKFSNKVMRIDKNRGVVFESTLATKKRDIPLDKLSSGEKHDFILFYQLIFHSKRNSIVLIDEPEISLHVAWQMEFVGVIKKICELNGIQAIIATHSPDIVNGNNDILVSLGE